jgi:hypothetical protein
VARENPRGREVPEAPRAELPLSPRTPSEWAVLGGAIGLCVGIVAFITFAVYLPEEEDLPWEAFGDVVNLVATGGVIGLVLGVIHYFRS